MYTIVPCAAGCGQPATTGSVLCGDHCANRAAESARITEFILRSNPVRNLSAGRLEFHDVDFSGWHFNEASFVKSIFMNCKFNKCVWHTVFFDFAVLDNCDFCESNMDFSSFGGARITGCQFSKSELTNLNFIGAKISDCDFSESNLYNSRFIAAEMQKVLMVDCNVKKVFFINTDTTDVNFRLSNSREAVFEMEDDW
jgi:uncharacterized protein YjbI with pentapeptide repeats